MGKSNGNSGNSSPKPAGGRYPKQGSTVLPDFKFVRCELSDDDKAELARAVSSETIVPFDAIGLVEQGYKLSLSHDKKGNCFIASATDRRVGSKSENYCLSARAANAPAALCALYYKHSVLLDGNWEQEVDNRPADLWGFG